MSLIPSVNSKASASTVLRNRKEVASGREDRELPHVIELVKAFDQRDEFMHSMGSQRLECLTAAIAKLFSQLSTGTGRV